MATYTVISQNTTTGSIDETKTYDNFRYAEIHYDNLSTMNSNRVIRQESTPNGNNIITTVLPK